MLRLRAMTSTNLCAASGLQLLKEPHRSHDQMV